jgi:hypothetical protein
VHICSSDDEPAFCILDRNAAKSTSQSVTLLPLLYSSRGRTFFSKDRSGSHTRQHTPATIWRDFQKGSCLTNQTAHPVLHVTTGMDPFQFRSQRLGLYLSHTESSSCCLDHEGRQARKGGVRWVSPFPRAGVPVPSTTEVISGRWWSEFFPTGRHPLEVVSTHRLIDFGAFLNLSD